MTRDNLFTCTNVALWATLASVSMAACWSCHVIAPQATPTPPVITDQASCAAACAHMADLSCPQADPVETGHRCVAVTDCLGPDGGVDTHQECVDGGCQVSCTELCKATEDDGVWLDPGCVARASTCDDVDRCPAPVSTGASCTGPSCQVAPSGR